jgi:hypothetical protein
VENAAKIFEAVESSTAAGHEISAMTILIGPAGGISLVADCDWPLDSLQAHRGAEMVYRVSQQNRSVRLEGRAGSRTCLFEATRPDGVARSLLAPSLTKLHHQAAIPTRLPASTAPLPPAALD